MATRDLGAGGASGHTPDLEDMPSAGGLILGAGPIDAPAILFIHGTRLTRMAWTPQLRAFAGPYRAIALDLPGHGSRSGEPFTLEAAVEVTAATIRESTQDGRAIVVGLSLGGYVAMALAAREPDLVRGLVLSGATAEPSGVRILPFLAYAWILSTAPGLWLDRASGTLFRRWFPPDIAEPIIAGGFWSINGAAAVRAVARERFLPRLAAFPGPCLLVNGEYDLPFRLFAPTFAAAAADPRRVRIAGASHLANLDRPAAFTAAVRRFADSLPPG